MAATQPREALDISAILPDRETVRFRTDVDPDGTLYELRSPEEFTLAELQQRQRDLVRIAELFQNDKPAKPRNGVDPDAFLNDQVATLIVGLTPGQVAAVPPAQKLQVVRYFSERLRTHLVASLGQPTPSTGPES